MRRTLVVLLGLMVGLMPVVAGAGLDPKPDSFGVYFDNAGMSNCTTATPFVPFPVYLLLMNPTASTNGFECTLTPVGAPYFILGTDLGANALDVDGSANGYAVGAASPYPVNGGGAIVLVTLNFMVQAATPVDFFITKATAPSLPGNLPVVTGEGILRSCNVSSCDVALSVATVNGGCPIINCGGLPQETNVSINITASAAGLQDSEIRAATAASATDNYDGGVDIPKPTPPPASYVVASFEHPGWPLGPRFANDIRDSYDPLADYKIWPLMIETDRSGDITLAFTPDFATGSGILFYLRDTQTGQFYNLFPALSYVFTNNGLPNTYRFELIVGAAPVPPPLNPTERSIPVGWSMVGLPLTPQPGATVASVLTDPPPGYAYAYDYLRTTGYHLLAPGTAVAQGTGYWLATDTAFNWTMNGTRDMDGVTVPLSNGWNLVGNTNWFPGPFEGLRVVQGANTYEWLAAAQLGLVSTDVQSYDAASGTYVDAVDLQPWHGYWINALQSNLSLQFYWGNFVELPKRLTAQKSVLDPDDPSWLSDLTLIDAADQRRTITFGMGANATAGFDALYDKPQPPQSPAGGPLLMFHRPEWDLAAGGAFSRDLFGLQDEVVSWNIVLSSPNQGRAFLNWNPKDWPDGVDFQLYLPHENRVAVMSMRKTTSFALTLGAQATQVVIRTPSATSGIGDLPARDYALTVSPNPFNPQTTIAFDLPSSGRAEVRIYSLRGELVAMLGGGSYEAGHHQEIWRGIDRQGRDVPSGSYFARLYVDGQARGAVTKMSLVR